MDDHYPVTDRMTRRAELEAIDDLTVIAAGAEGLRRRLHHGAGQSDQECVRLLQAIAAAAARVARTLNAGTPVRVQSGVTHRQPSSERHRIHARDN